MVEIEIEGADNFDLDAEKMEKYAEKLQENMAIATEAGAELFRDKLEEITPKETGFTASAWQVIQTGTGEYIVTNANEPIATFLSEGTIEHDIEAISGKALHFFAIGPLHYGQLGEGETGEFFFRRVHHPGTQALNLEDVAMLAVEDQIQALIETADDLAWKEASGI